MSVTTRVGRSGQRIGRRSGALAVVTVLVGSALSWAAPFTATTASASPVSDPALPPDLVSAIDRDLHISAQEYLERSARAQELRSYAETFRDARPAEYGGAWLAADGTPVVAVTSADAAATVARDGFRAQSVPVSADSLDASLDQFSTWASSLPREVSSQINSVSVDLLQNKVVVDIINSALGRLLNLPALIANLQVILSPPPPAPGAAAIGGDGYATSDGPLTDPASVVEVCSFGFNAVDSRGRAVTVSAGHCVPDANRSAAVHLADPVDVRRGVRVGSFVRSSVGTDGALDYSVIALNDAGIAAGLDRPAVRGIGGGSLRVTGTATPVVGAPVCKSGDTSSFTCGVVSADRVRTQLYLADGTAPTVEGFSTTACTLAGDSGGAIVTGTLALGITSGSNVSSARSCVDAALSVVGFGGTASLGMPIRPIADAAGLTIRTTS